MKKLDKLILEAFTGPFLLTFVVVVFILLVQFIMKYFDDIVGKGLGGDVYAQLLFYFSLLMVPVALPLSVLLSSLITFGNLGEHHELTAIKGSGVSLVRALLPVFLLTILLTVAAFYFNNNIAPKASLKAYSLLYDVRTKKATINFKEGVFYEGIPGYRIKISEKFPDGKAVKGVMIYDHTGGKGNTDLVVADSGIISTQDEDRYLIFELFKGKSFSEYADYSSGRADQFVRNSYDRSRMVFSLSSFELNHTKEELFSSNKLMKNVDELSQISDSIKKDYSHFRGTLFTGVSPFFSYMFIPQKNMQQFADASTGIKMDTSAKAEEDASLILSRAANQARNIKAYASSQVEREKYMTEEANSYLIEKHKKYAQAVACMIMFLIGAPLGAIIKKGGLGVPVLISIFFFIIFYVFSIMGEKWAKESLVSVPQGIWAANVILFPVGLLFLRQARNDSRLFEMDFYLVIFKKWFKTKQLVSA